MTSEIRIEYNCTATSDVTYISHALEGRSCCHIARLRETTEHVAGQGNSVAEVLPS
jgi:hypothetical protein